METNIREINGNTLRLVASTFLCEGCCLFDEETGDCSFPQDKHRECLEMIYIFVKQEPNCLTRALDQWLDNPDFVLWYNSNHVISLEPEYMGGDLTALKSYMPLDYLGLEEYGYEHLVKSFSLTGKYSKILSDYFKHIQA